jgi:rod shape-determining protein MreC
MESVLGRYRNLIILVGVLFLQVLGLATQVKRGGNDPENTRLIRVWAVGAITPFERVLIWAQNGTGNIWHNYFYLRGVRAENRQLKDQIEQMRLEQVRLSEDAAQARRLQSLVAFKEQFISRTVAAQVIGSSGSDLSRIVYIDKGENAGIRRDMAVITADGIVGKVLVAYASVSQVLLISDQSSGVGALLEKTRLQGVLRGTANGEVVLERVMSDEQVSVGETVLTSGGDQIFPKGLPVGAVTKVGTGKDLFLSIKVKPAADLSKLEEVLVLVENKERQATAEENVRVRASDILAQRLPSVPDKPAGASPAAGTAAGITAGTTAGSAKPAVAKPAAKPAGSATPIITPPTTPTAKSPSGGNGVPGAPASGTSAKPADGTSAGTSTAKKSVPAAASAASDPKSGTSSAASSAPASAPPKKVEPTPPPDNSQPPAAESSPQ